MTTCKTVLEIAIRLESGFKKRFQKIDSGDLPSADRWVNCAIGLLLLHQQDERYPLDPELFVAVMTEAVAIRLLFSGAIDVAMAHYSKAIRTMVRRLRAEISEELCRQFRCYSWLWSRQGLHDNSRCCRLFIFVFTHYGSTIESIETSHGLWKA